MGLRAHVVVSFRLGPQTPESIRFEGVIEWTDPDVMNDKGYPIRIVRVQCGLRTGPNGPFLTMPYVRRLDQSTGRLAPVKTGDGKYRNYVDLGPHLQQVGVQAVIDHLNKPPSDPQDTRPAPTVQTDMREAARQAFRESGGAEGIAPVGESTPDDPFGRLEDGQPW